LIEAKSKTIKQPTGLSVEGTAIRHVDRRAVQDGLQTRRIGIGHACANYRTAST
jgi:hypothetical protein